MARQYSGDALTGWARADTLRVMRLWRGRRWARLLAAMLLAASVRLPHAAQDDLACSALFAGASSQDGSTLIPGAGLTPQADHCAICHWTRLLRSPLAADGVAIGGVGPATLVSRVPLSAPSDPVHQKLSARAPPSTLL
jgi:hypothetical protein